jgi:ACS family glucarate transporter-like MFS transporter
LSTLADDTPAAVAARPTRARYVVMAFLGTLAFLTYHDRFCITRAEGAIKADLGIQDWQMGLIMGAFWLAYALFELPGGWMGDRFGARSTLVRIVLAWSLFTALSGMAKGFASLLTFRFIFGVGEAGAFPNMARVQSRWMPVASRAAAGGMLWLLARWGGALSPLIIGLMMRGFDSPGFRSTIASLPLLDRFAHTAAWRLAFVASGVMGIIWVVAFWIWFRDHPSEKRGVNAAELDLITRGAPPEVKGHGMPRVMWRALLTDRSLWAMGVYYLCGSFGWSFFASWMPRFFKEVQGVSYQRSELMSAAPLLVGGLTCLLGGVLSQRLVARTGRKRLGRALFPILGASTAAVGMFLIPMVRTPLEATLLLCVVSGAYDFGQAANWATIVDIGGKYAGSSAGMINTIGNMGNAFQPVIGALIFTAFGWNVLFVIYSLMFLVAASMWLIIDPRRTFYEASRDPAAIEVLSPVAAVAETSA